MRAFWWAIALSKQHILISVLSLGVYIWPGICLCTEWRLVSDIILVCWNSRNTNYYTVHSKSIYFIDVNTIMSLYEVYSLCFRHSAQEHAQLANFKDRNCENIKRVKRNDVRFGDFSSITMMISDAILFSRSSPNIRRYMAALLQGINRAWKEVRYWEYQKQGWMHDWTESVTRKVYRIFGI
jgi:hypothetical protein